MTSYPESGMHHDGSEHHKSHHEWVMNAEVGRAETDRDLMDKVISRIDVYDEGEDIPKNAMVFEYPAEAYNTEVEYWDEEREGMAHVQLSLGEYLNDSDADYRQKEEIEEDIATQYYGEHPSLDKGWWLHFDNARYPQVESEFFHDRLPTEQLIVGQGDKGVRFYNYSHAMNEEQVADCIRFVDILSQYMGDRTYDIVQDVVITDFYQPPDGEVLDGFATQGVAFIDGALLHPDASRSSVVGEQVSNFLRVLVHESGHLIHGHGEQEDVQLDTFARDIGWDLEPLEQDGKSWRSSGEDYKTEYAPQSYRDAIKVTLPNGQSEVMGYGEYLDRFEEAYDEEGNDLRPPFEFAGKGVPSSYAQKNPMESSAEVTTYAMLEGEAMDNMPQTRDAWLEHLQQRVLKPGERPEDRPIASRLDRLPVVCERLTGNDILYPVTELPDSIPVYAKPRSQVYGEAA